MCVSVYVQKRQYLRSVDQSPQTGFLSGAEKCMSLNVCCYLYHRDICLFPDINIYFNINRSDVYFLFMAANVPVSTVYTVIQSISILTNHHVCKHLCNIKTRLCGRAVHCMRLRAFTSISVSLRISNILQTHCGSYPSL